MSWSPCYLHQSQSQLNLNINVHIDIHAFILMLPDWNGRMGKEGIGIKEANEWWCQHQNI